MIPHLKPVQERLRDGKVKTIPYITTNTTFCYGSSLVWGAVPARPAARGPRPALRSVAMAISYSLSGDLSVHAIHMSEKY